MPEPLGSPGSHWLRERARRTPGLPALRFAGEELSFGALAKRVHDAALRLAALGVGPGDRVVLVHGASLRFVEIVHALQRLGATLVPSSPRSTPPEVEALVADSKPRLVLAEEEAAPVAAGAGVRVVEAGRDLDAVPPVSALPEARLDPASIHSVLFTSGTTGRPKGAMLTHASHFASAAASRANLGIRPADRWLLAMPLHHVGGLSILLRSVIDGVPVELHPRFDPAEVERALREDGVTLVSLVPTMLERLLAVGRPPWPRLRAVLLGGAAAPPALVRRATEAGVPVAPTYGLTEAASQVTTMPPGEASARPGASGRALAGTAVRIDAPDADGVGEILVRGPTVMAGYLDRPQETAAALQGGWLHTGDAGRLDADGFLHVVDRRTDLVVTGGENVYPAEVEAVLLAHPAVAEAGVYGESDPEWGRRVAAAVVTRPGTSASAAELEAWCAPRLAPFKRPKRFAFVAGLPRTASGKLRRAGLAETAARPPSR